MLSVVKNLPGLMRSMTISPEKIQEIHQQGRRQRAFS